MNLSNSSVPQLCPHLGPFAWKKEYLSTTVYINLVLTSAINGLCFPFTFLFNMLVIFCIISRTQLRRRRSNELLGLLSVTDLAVGMIVQPLFLGSEICRITGRCKICDIDTVSIHLVYICCAASFGHLTLIGLERYIAIKYSLRYKQLVTTNRLIAGSAFIWAGSILIPCVALFGVHGLTIRVVSGFIMSSFFLLILYCYLTIYRESRRHRRCIMSQTTQKELVTHRRVEFRATKTTALIFGGVLLSYVPLLLRFLLIYFVFPLNQSNAFIWMSVFFWTQTRVMLNSLCNPFIYYWRDAGIRETILSTLKRQKKTAIHDKPRMEMVEKSVQGRKQRKISSLEWEDQRETPFPETLQHQEPFNYENDEAKPDADSKKFRLPKRKHNKVTVAVDVHQTCSNL